MRHYLTLSRDGKAFVAQCDCDWRSGNEWDLDGAVKAYEDHCIWPMVPTSHVVLPPANYAATTTARGTSAPAMPAPSWQRWRS